jgi:MFS family permease
MRIFKPLANFSNKDSDKALRLVVRDGIFSEAMVTLTTGTFLTALALKLGASNFHIGLLAAIPTLANLFPFIAIWLLKKLPNRRFLTVSISIIARLPLLIIGASSFFMSPGSALYLTLAMFFIHQSLAAVAGTVWTSWMKDVVPPSQLGTYFSKRSRVITFFSLMLGLAIAGALDFVKSGYPALELKSYSTLFILGGIIGLAGVIFLGKTPEPQMEPLKFKSGKSLLQPLKDPNYRMLLIYQSVWTFATNLAVPFFTVYQLSLLKIPVSMVIIFSILNQLAVALFVKIWGMYTDRFSNKTILQICSPVFLLCILGWTYTSLPGSYALTLPLVGLLHFVSGAAFAGINLAITNISIKLAPKDNTVSYISAKAMLVAMVSGIAPILAGALSGLIKNTNIGLRLPVAGKTWHFIEIQNWDLFFVVAVVVGALSMLLLRRVNEEGAVDRSAALKKMYRKLRMDVNPKRHIRAVVRVISGKKQSSVAA